MVAIDIKEPIVVDKSTERLHKPRSNDMFVAMEHCSTIRQKKKHI
jgi:hypothetical protein